MKIDFVVTWVDNHDPKWIADKQCLQQGKSTTSDDSDKRYRETIPFKFWFRSVEKNAPWVNKIFLVTNGTIPEWIDKRNPKLVFVNHKDILKSSALPTFNSNAIELGIGNIEQLSENFVLFNDDVFINQAITEDFYFHLGVPRDEAVLTPAKAISSYDHTYLEAAIQLNNFFDKKKVIKKNFSKFFSPRIGLNNLVKQVCSLPFKGFSGFVDPHSAQAYLKSRYISTLSKIKNDVAVTMDNHFRTQLDTSHYVVRYFQFCEGVFFPTNVLRNRRYLKIEDSNRDIIINALRNPAVKVLCLNDTDDGVSDGTVKKISEELYKKFPDKSSFEI